MSAMIEADSTLTDRYQTTVPETVRRALKLRKRDKIHYSILSDGAVLLTRAVKPEEEDPVLGQFLDFLAHDIASHPERLVALDVGLVHRIKTLIDGAELNLDAPLSADDE
jgi:antitoxin PrlF